MDTSGSYRFLSERLDLLERLFCVQAAEIKRLQEENERLQKAQASTTGWIAQIEGDVCSLLMGK